MIAGFAIARLGADVPFWCCWVGSLAFVGALIWWRAPRRARETLPVERLISAMMTGVRYARYSRELDATLIRAVAFVPFASAYLALLPLVARTQMGGGPEVYGALMASIGAGSIAASFALKRLKARLGPDRLAALGTVGTILALLMFAAARELPLALLGGLFAGASSIVMLAILYVSAQVALPEWVRGRGLAIFLTFYFGAVTFGSAAWAKSPVSRGCPSPLPPPRPAP